MSKQPWPARSWGPLTHGKSPVEGDLTIRLAEGVERAADSGPAAWLRSRLLPSPKGATLVGSVIPTGFAEYARVFHPALGSRVPRDSGQETVRWSEVAEWTGRVAHPEMQWEAISQPLEQRTGTPPWEQEPEMGRLPLDARAALAAILAAHTSTPDLIWMCFWEGFAGVDEGLSGAPRVELPHRSYFLLRASLRVIEGTDLLVGPPVGGLGPSLWWPDDRAWCVASEVDFRWTYAGGTKASVDAILAERRLEALTASPQERADELSDRINRPANPR